MGVDPGRHTVDPVGAMTTEDPVASLLDSPNLSLAHVLVTASKARPDPFLLVIERLHARGQAVVRVSSNIRREIAVGDDSLSPHDLVMPPVRSLACHDFEGS